jgi:hypothetical protein
LSVPPPAFGCRVSGGATWSGWRYCNIRYGAGTVTAGPLPVCRLRLRYTSGGGRSAKLGDDLGSWAGHNARETRVFAISVWKQKVSSPSPWRCRRTRLRCGWFFRGSGSARAADRFNAGKLMAIVRREMDDEWRSAIGAERRSAAGDVHP